METNKTMEAYEKQKKTRLVVGILFDLLGMATLAFPALELGDMAWAPIAATVYYAMYRGLTGLIGGSMVFIEELFPFTDVIPTFTLTWLWVYQINGKKNMARFMKEAEEKSQGVIDITPTEEKQKLTA